MFEKYYQITSEVFVNKPLKEVFSFFERPENLQRITPKELGFEILTPSPIEMKVGAVIDYKIKLQGIPLKWKTLIAQYDPPNLFQDIQLNGPYVVWEHTHTFKSVDGGTLLGDFVNYRLPLGLLGRLAHTLWVRAQVENIFKHRQEVIQSLFD